MLMRVEGPAVDALVSFATYSYDESICGIEGKARDPFWTGAHILIVPAAYAPAANIRCAVEALYTVVYGMMMVRQMFNIRRFMLLSKSGVSFSETIEVTKARSGSSFKIPFIPINNHESFAYLRNLGHITDGSEGITMPARFYAGTKSMAPFKLPALMSLAGTEPALLLNIMAVSCLQASKIQILGLKDGRVISRLPHSRKIMLICIDVEVGPH